VPRECPPGRVPAGIAAEAPVTAGAASRVPAAHRARPPPRSSARRTAPAQVRAADARSQVATTRNQRRLSASLVQDMMSEHGALPLPGRDVDFLDCMEEVL
jgi:hypothetical protein